MATFKLDRSEWQPYFGTVSKEILSSAASVLVQGLDLGVQVEAEKLPLLGLSYDRTSDALLIITETLEHPIPHPSEVWVKENDAGHLESFEVVDGEGHTQIVEIEPALTMRTS